MVRATMPVLKEAPKLTQEDIAKIHEADQKASFGGPVSGKISQSSKKNLNILTRSRSRIF
jgi:hypothetical protein